MGSIQQEAEEHEAPGRRSSNWAVAAGWLCFGLYSVLAAHRLVLGAAQVGVAVAYSTDEMLARRAISRLRLNLIRLLAAVVFLATIATAVSFTRWERP